MDEGMDGGTVPPADSSAAGFVGENMADNSSDARSEGKNTEGNWLLVVDQDVMSTADNKLLAADSRVQAVDG
jgi:hypothetical protein